MVDEEYEQINFDDYNIPYLKIEFGDDTNS